MDKNTSIITTLELQLKAVKDRLPPEELKKLAEYIDDVKQQKDILKTRSKNELIETCLRLCEVAKEQAKNVREKVVGTDNQSAVIVSFNEGAEESVTVDQLHPPELNQQNVFFSEEAERKLIVAHSAPPILFSGSNQGSGFSSNADEIAVATKGLYRRHINPIREVILNGLGSIFNLIDTSIKLDFKDFEEETEITTAQ